MSKKKNQPEQKGRTEVPEPVTGLLAIRNLPDHALMSDNDIIKPKSEVHAMPEHINLSCFCPKCDAEMLIYPDEDGVIVTSRQGGSGVCWSSMLMSAKELILFGPCPTCSASIRITMADGNISAISIRG